MTLSKGNKLFLVLEADEDGWRRARKNIAFLNEGIKPVASTLPIPTQPTLQV
jgi:hypothetical protein